MLEKPAGSSVLKQMSFQASSSIPGVTSYLYCYDRRSNAGVFGTNYTVTSALTPFTWSIPDNEANRAAGVVGCQVSTQLEGAPEGPDSVVLTLDDVVMTVDPCPPPPPSPPPPDPCALASVAWDYNDGDRATSNNGATSGTLYLERASYNITNAQQMVRRVTPACLLQYAGDACTTSSPCQVLALLQFWWATPHTHETQV